MMSSRMTELCVKIAQAIEDVDIIDDDVVTLTIVVEKHELEIGMVSRQIPNYDSAVDLLKLGLNWIGDVGPASALDVTWAVTHEQGQASPGA